MVFWWCIVVLIKNILGNFVDLFNFVNWIFDCCIWNSCFIKGFWVILNLVVIIGLVWEWIICLLLKCIL